MSAGLWGLCGFGLMLAAAAFGRAAWLAGNEGALAGAVIVGLIGAASLMRGFETEG